MKNGRQKSPFFYASLHSPLLIIELESGIVIS